MEVDREELPLDVHRNTSTKAMTLNFVTFFDQDPKWVCRLTLPSALGKNLWVLPLSISIITSWAEMQPTKRRVSDAK